MLLRDTDFIDLPLFVKGKVRDIYEVGEDKLLMITTDRISAFDVVFDDLIPNKGRVLNAISEFWFNYTRDHWKPYHYYRCIRVPNGVVKI